MIVFEAVHPDVVAAVRMFAPVNVYSPRVRVVEFVIVLCRPLHVDSRARGITEAVIEAHFERGRVEEVIQLGGCERLCSVDYVTNGDQSWPIKSRTVTPNAGFTGYPDGFEAEFMDKPHPQRANPSG